MQHSWQANYKYLIGGMDLEMATIIELLEQNKLQIINLQLTWGASLSAYKAYFNDEDTFVGIELTQDIEPFKPPNKEVWVRKRVPNERLQKSLDILLDQEMKLLVFNNQRNISSLFVQDENTTEITYLRKCNLELQIVRLINDSNFRIFNT
ncbi:MAG: hypothetical protein Q8O88_00085 [bacterium]|nr:hypothetical protein [bacterium]